MAKQPRQTIDFIGDEIKGTTTEKSQSSGIMSCVPVGSEVRVKASSPGELEETKRRLNEVVEIGAQFATLRHDPRVPSLASRLVLRRQALTETKVLAKVTVTIKGQQLGDNGAPKLVDMGWVFKWTPVVNDPNTRMEVNYSPTVGIHNIIHDQSPVTVDQALNFDPHVEAKGIVFCFTFKKPNKASSSAAASGTRDPLLAPAVEITFCDFEVNFEPEHRFLQKRET
ncbi:hypothetical protein QFC22_005727 [Naganishia vaughanmartiniae]|uniref:Uncharacterized protein n=1 Tax=Naganishia vaughanmartiniae TaxID=1424756 RepID=A0ACC2WSI2_9TREE|nr:hypothetical protein QFC22_005727 [Naganishia vaughanmartiniae]